MRTETLLEGLAFPWHAQLLIDHFCQKYHTLPDDWTIYRNHILGCKWFYEEVMNHIAMAIRKNNAYPYDEEVADMIKDIVSVINSETVHYH